jgi:hypothetical protein
MVARGWVSIVNVALTRGECCRTISLSGKFRVTPSRAVSDFRCRNRERCARTRCATRAAHPSQVKKLYVAAVGKYKLPWTLLAGIGIAETGHGGNTTPVPPAPKA